MLNQKVRRDARQTSTGIGAKWKPLIATAAAIALMGGAIAATPAVAAEGDPVEAVSLTNQNYKGEEIPGNGDLLDLFVPAHTEGEKIPLLIVSNGCAFTCDTGKNLAPTYRQFFNDRGWAVAGVSIRSGAQANSPAQIQDVKDSIRWLRANADEYGLDPDRFAFGGFSSGAWVAATAATMGDSTDPEMEGTNPDTVGVDDAVQAFFTYALPGDFRTMDAQAGRPYNPETNTLGAVIPTNTPGAAAGYVHPNQINWAQPVSVADENGIAIAPTSVSGVILTHQPTNSPESGLVGCAGGSEPVGLMVPECVWADKSSPVRYATPADPRGLIMHGGTDNLLPYLQSQALYDNLTAAGVDVTYQWVGNQGHTGSFPASVANNVRRVQQSVDGVKLPVREYFGTAAAPITDELPTMEYVFNFLAGVFADLDALEDSQQRIEVTFPELAPGEFAWAIDGTNDLVSLGTATENGDFFEAAGEINPVRVIDSRRSGAEWSISAQVSDFSSTSGSFSSSYLGWTPEVITEGAGAQAGGAISGAADGPNAGLSASQTLAFANSGHPRGEATVGADLALKVPVDLVGQETYNATLTLTALS